MLLIPEHAYFRQLCDRIASVFANLDITDEELQRTLPEARQRAFERHYRELVLEMVPGVQFCNSTIANEGSVFKINALN